MMTTATVNVPNPAREEPRRSPELAVFAVVFLLFSNLAVVASRFHGVPKVIAGSFVLILGFPLVRHLVLRRERIILAPAIPFLLLWLGVQIIGMVFSRDYSVTKTVVSEFALEGLLIFLLVTNTVRSTRALRVAVWGLLLAGFVSAIVPCYQQLTGSYDRDFGGLGQVSEVGFRTGEVTQHGEGRQRRLAGPIGEQNRYAQNMLMLLPIGLFFVLGRSSRRAKIIASILVGVSGAGFILAFSRGGAVAFAMVILAMTLMRVITLRQLSVVAVLAALGLAATPQYWARLSTIGDVTKLFSGEGVRSKDIDSAMKRRIAEMIAAGMVFVDHPVVGVGPGMFKYYSAEYGNRLGIRKITGTRKAHSLYLEVAAEGGSLGLFAFFGMVFVTLFGLVSARRHLLRIPTRTPPDEERERRELAGIVTGFLLALIAYLASALFLHLSYIRFFYLILALGAAAGSVAISRFGGSGDSPQDASVTGGAS